MLDLYCYYCNLSGNQIRNGIVTYTSEAAESGSGDPWCAPFPGSSVTAFYIERKNTFSLYDLYGYALAQEPRLGGPNI